MRQKQKEQEDFERDLRTIFVSHLSLKVDEKRLRKFFEDKQAVVRDVRLITDRMTRRSKGFGYVELGDRESLEKAVLCYGQPLEGMAILIQKSDAEKNRAAAAAAAAAAQATVTQGGPLRLYVGGLHTSITDKDLRSVFDPFGPIDAIDLHQDTVTGRSKGFAFIQYKKSEDAKRALQQMNGFELVGKPIKVGLVNDSKTEAQLVSGELDDDDVALNSTQRAALMAKLNQREDGVGTGGGGPTLPGLPPHAPMAPSSASLAAAQAAAAAAASQAAAAAMARAGAGGLSLPLGLSMMAGVGGTMGIGYPLQVPSAVPMAPAMPPTRFLALRNMFDRSTATSDDFRDIQEDVEQECTRQGSVEKVYLDPKSDGCVFVRFSDSDGASKARASLDHRWFAGKKISAEFIPESGLPPPCR